jgi:hypothetical protein
MQDGRVQVVNIDQSEKKRQVRMDLPPLGVQSF